jgi:hypothetical protein
MTRKVTVEEMLLAQKVDATALEQAIRQAISGWDVLVASRVLSSILVEEARKLHGVQMKVLIEPK